MPSKEERNEISLGQLNEILGTTICEDQRTKPIIFLCFLTAYTQQDAFNILLKAESSAGKSWDVLQCADYFPSADVVECGYASPTAFFHEQGTYNKKTKAITVDLERKILIFLDQPGDMLLQRLRPLLSHDRKIITAKITDRKQKAGLRTKTVRIKGYFSSAYCTARLGSDEQELTRAFVLSPEISQEKLQKALKLTEFRKSRPEEYRQFVEQDPGRLLIKQRVLGVKNANIRHVLIPDYEQITRNFNDRHSLLKPRHLRDYERVFSLIKAWALLNFQNRKRVGSDVQANATDIQVGFQLYDLIREANDLGLPPGVYEVYKQVIEPEAKEAGEQGADRLQIMQRYLRLFGRALPPHKLKELLPALEAAGLIVQEPDPNDRRKTLVKSTSHQEALV